MSGAIFLYLGITFIVLVVVGEFANKRLKNYNLVVKWAANLLIIFFCIGLFFMLASTFGM